MKNFRNVDFVYWPITIKFRIRKKTSKPQTNYRCCLRFSYLAPYWLISRSKITFHRYFWCSRFCEFHSKCEFGEQELWVVLTFFELGSSYHLTDTKINDVKVLFLDYHIKTSYYCNNLQPECLPESSASSPSAADKSINDSKVRKENLLPTQLFIYCALMK